MEDYFSKNHIRTLKSNVFTNFGTKSFELSDVESWYQSLTYASKFKFYVHYSNSYIYSDSMSNYLLFSLFSMIYLSLLIALASSFPSPAYSAFYISSINCAYWGCFPFIYKFLSHFNLAYINYLLPIFAFWNISSFSALSYDGRSSPFWQNTATRSQS